VITTSRLALATNSRSASISAETAEASLGEKHEANEEQSALASQGRQTIVIDVHIASVYALLAIGSPAAFGVCVYKKQKRV
jgi:hypothetical protein